MIILILFLVAAVRRRRHKLRLSPIPEHLLVNERCNLLSNDTTGCANAVQAQYARERMRSPLLRGMKAIAWDDGMCFDGISRVHSAALARAIRHEGNGMYKSDACRLAQLAEHGGYYLDNDVVPHIDVRELGAARVGCASHPSFIAVRQSWEPVQFLNAFVAATPRHPIIMRALNLTARFYNVDTPPERGGLDGGLREWWVGRSMGNLPYTDPGSTACDALLLWEHRPRQRMLDCAQGPLAAVLLIRSHST
ncbi:co-chaperone GrpE [Emiliania huxleyi CCMP1516]|uniref:Alpha 1,4-glycosyltransferase domain-containing protein n=2 Tax=Emiliania huxleyi TaxID=2903 RepID=A0A0D3JY28_EMIH1|nr:co-chaperone GrpE [Emiliania huxleyi CCMP1516]EOD28413.1 co-chaperone GrpE [Emiliania huxleyi CCMP1516]|eukprot:XP_005780842.1 co-chaperone GrpE [Emiliania huxleyi CCMP1516]